MLRRFVLLCLFVSFRCSTNWWLFVYFVCSVRMSVFGVLFLFLVMLIVFIAGFFIDFIEIIFIIVPVVAPVFHKMGVDLIWIGVLLGLNLQTSFLTPPFGFSLFYLKGVAPPSVTTAQIYRGIIPFILIQLIVLGIYIFMRSLLIIP